jgi:KUP system potassium uptake protein
VKDQVVVTIHCGSRGLGHQLPLVVVPLPVAVAAFLTMATWRWGRKATFAAYAPRSTLTMAELVALHRSGTGFLERNALIMAPVQVRHPTDRAPALVGLLWERYGILPRNLILVEVPTPKSLISTKTAFT